MSLDEFAGSSADYCPHECPNCGGPAYLGLGVPAKCIERGCVFYDEDTWVGWLMRLDDTGDPPVDCDEPDFFDEEPTQPQPYGITFKGIPCKGTTSGRFSTYKVGGQDPPTQGYGDYLDEYGKLIGIERIDGESDVDFQKRMLAIWTMRP